MQNQPSKIYSRKFSEIFSCIGSECKMTCCKGWSVVLDKPSFERYRKTPELSNQIQKGGKHLRRTKDTYGFMKLKADGACSMLGNDNTCGVYNLLGEESLSKTCNTFPRTIFKANNECRVHFSVACPEVAKLLCSDPQAMDMSQNGEAVKSTLKYVSVDAVNDLACKRATYDQILKFLVNSSLPLWKKVIAVTSLFDAQNHSKISTEDVKANLFKKQLLLEKNSEMVSTEIFQYETYSEVIFSDKILEKINDQVLGYINQAKAFMGVGSDSFDEQVKRYLLRKKLLIPKKELSNEMIWTNLYSNFIDKDGPQLYENRDQFLRNLAYSTILLGLIKFLSITSIQVEEEKPLDWFYHLVAAVVRSIDHNSNVKDMIYENLVYKFPSEQERIAMLALMIN